MSSKFTDEERKKYLLNRHIKNHLFEYVLDVIGTVVMTIIILLICKVDVKSESYVIGIGISLLYGMFRVLYDICYYKKEYINIDNKNNIE